MSESSIPYIGGAEAQVNPPEEVTLYDDNQHPFRVPAGDAAYWLARGYTRTAVDVQAAAQALVVALAPLDNAVKALAAALAPTADDTVPAINPASGAELDVAVMAMREVELAWGQLERGISVRHTVRQGAGVALVSADGLVGMQVDPGQVEHYTAQGWQLAAGAGA